MTDTAVFDTFRNLLPRLLRTPVRFPVPLACGVAWASVSIARDHQFGGLQWDDVERLQVLFVSGFFVTLAGTLFAEGRDWNWFARQAIAAVALALVAFVVFSAAAQNAYDGPASYMLGPGGVLLMTVAPFLRRGADSQAVWTFNLCSWVSALFGLIVALALGLGLMALLGGLETLFGADIPSRVYGDVWMVCMSVVWPWQTLAGVPGGFDMKQDGQAPRWAEYLISWLLVPLALAYLGMLVAFALMILGTWNLPRGTIGWLVGIFGAFGVAVWSAVYALRASGNVVVRLYHRYFHFALFVPVLLLAVGVGARVLEYGITEKRYALLLLTAWLAAIGLYGVLRRPAHLVVAPAAIGAMLIVGSFGPWGATSVSLRSQLRQLEALLTDAGIFVDGRIEPDQGLADQQQVRRISDIVRYMRRSGKLTDLKDWLAEAGAKPKTGEDNYALLAHMGLDYVEAWERDGEFSWSVGEYETIDVAGFEAVHHLSLGTAMTETIAATSSGRRYQARFDGRVLTVTLAGRPSAKAVFDLDAMAEMLRPIEIEWGDPAGRKAMTLEAGENGLRARLHVENMGGRNTANGNEIEHGRAVLLVGWRD